MKKFIDPVYRVLITKVYKTKAELTIDENIKTSSYIVTDFDTEIKEYKFKECGNILESIFNISYEKLEITTEMYRRLIVNCFKHGEKVDYYADYGINNINRLEVTIQLL